MNTIKLKLFLLTTLALVMTGCGTDMHGKYTMYAYRGYDIPPVILPTVSLQVEGVKVSQDLGKHVFAEVEGSPRLTEALNHALTRSGFVVASSKNKADMVYEIEGGYTAQRRWWKDIHNFQISLGAYAESPDSLVASDRMKQLEATKIYFAMGEMPQTANVTLSRKEGGNLIVTKAVVQLDKNHFMTPTFMFQSALDALVQSTGLPRNSLRVSERSAGI